MNKGHQLLDKTYMLKLLKNKVLPLYPAFVDIKSISIIPHKDLVWEGDAYHVVAEYRTRFVTPEGKIKSLPIFCSAHSYEPRRNVYQALEFLWENGFGRGYLTVPHPLFYSDYFQGTFYRGIKGENLYHYIKLHDFHSVREIVPKAAKWFAKLHSIDPARARNFNQENSRIKTVYPGIPHILERIGEDYPQYRECFAEIYDIVNNKEEEYFHNAERQWVVHGDAHPENVIKMGQKKIGLIDFTDICLSDYTRDVGTFMQQLEYMINRKIKDNEFACQMAGLFKDEYLRASKKELSDDIQERIDNYYYWTTMRTATYFMLKSGPEPGRAYPLIDRVCRHYGLAPPELD